MTDLQKEFEATGYTSWINANLYPDGKIYTQEYTEWLEKQVQALRIALVVGRSEQLVCPDCKLPFTKEELQIKEHCFNCGWEFVN